MNTTVIIRYACYVAFAALLSCGEDKRPEGILSQKQMVQVLMEVYVAEDKVSRMGVNMDSAQKVIKIFKQKAFERTGVSDTVFKRSFNYYMDRPKEMELIYTALVDSLNLREQRSSFRPEAQ